MILRTPFTCITVLAAAILIPGLAAAGTAAGQSTAPVRPSAGKSDRKCPPPGDVVAALSKASDALQHAQYNVAIETLQPASTLNCDPRISLLLAAAFEGSNHPDAAEQTLQQAHAVWPANTSIAASLAREYISNGQVKEAAKALRYLHATPEMPWQEMQLAIVVFLADHQLAKAEALAQLGYKNYPSIESLLLLANSLQLEGRYKDVISLLQSKRVEYAQSPKFLVTIAESEYDAKIFDAARRDLEDAIKFDPKLYQAHYLLGNVLQQVGDMDQAVTEYRIATSLAPDQPRTYYQLALALRAKQDEAGEESALTKALTIDNHFALAHAELGRILLNENRVEDSVEQLNLAIQSNPSLEQPYNLLARAYMRLGNTEKANAMAKRLAEVRSANHHAVVRGGMQTETNHVESP
jgi:Flp pilus assembly protein TadD